MTTPDERATLGEDLRPYPPWQAAPGRRVELPKANGQPRPLGIPTRRDRVRHLVVKHALEPRGEAACAAQSAGFRPGRCGQEARAAVDGALHNGAVGHPPYLLDADIPGAFDPIRHGFLLHRMGPRPGRELIQQWRHAGSWAGGTLHHTTEGPPQGGVVSPLWANLARDGRAKRRGRGDRGARYADDIVVMANSRPALAPARPVVTAVLAARGRALHPAQTRLGQRTEAGDCLGCHGQRRGQTLRITPPPQTGPALRQAGRSGLKAHPTVTAEVGMRHLPPRSRGWALDDRHVVRQHPFPPVDDHSGSARWPWVTRRPPRQPRRWRYRRSFEGGKYGATC